MPLDYGFGQPGDQNAIYGDWRATSDKGIIKEREKRMAGVLPGELYQAYNKLASQGIYSPAEIANIINRVRASNAIRRTQQMAGLKNTMARRLGSRSGALGNALLNAQVPMQAQENDLLANLWQTTYGSRLAGIQGKHQLRNDLVNSTQNAWWKGGSGPGALDIIKGIGTVGSMF